MAESKGAFNRVEDRTPARMDCPGIDPVDRQRLAKAGLGQRGGDPAGHLAGQMHRKALIGDVPADQRVRIGQRRRERRVENQAGRFGADQAGRRAVAELQHRKQGFHSVAFLEMERGQLDRHHQHPCPGVGADDVTRAAQRRYCRIASHEADQQPFDAGSQAKRPGENLIDARRDEAGAAGHHQMGDLRRVGIERPHRVERESGGGSAVDPHPGGRAGQRRAIIEAARTDRGTAARRFRQHRPAMLDPGALDHPAEQTPLARIIDAGRRPVDEGRMDVLVRHRRPDRVQIGLAHPRSFCVPRWRVTQNARLAKPDARRSLREHTPLGTSAAMASAQTPMMAQYLRLKAEAGDCLLFYRMGDFFELFFDDAKAAAAALDIALTARGEHDGQKVPMCGVPVHAAETYLARLIKAGFRVAIAEQTESPAEAKARGSKALVERAIVRFVTAGTLTEEALLDARRANWLVALAEVAGSIGLAAADISTGRFEIAEFAPDLLEAQLAHYAAAEVIAPEGFARAAAIPRPKPDFETIAAERRLCAHFGLATLDGLGGFGRAGVAAAGGLVAYLAHVGQGNLPFLQRPAVRAVAAHMLIDAATRESLELCQAQSGGRAGSLLDAIDRTVTGGGARLLAADLGAPLTDRDAIQARLDLVTLFADDALRHEVRTTLRALPDIGRALGRLVAGRGSPRDLAQLRDGLAEARRLRDRLVGIDQPPVLLAALLPALAGHATFVDLLARALVPSPPVDAAQGGYIAEGYDAALDELRGRGGEGRRAIAGLEARYRDKTGIAALKIRHNAVLGYHVEVPARHADRLVTPDSGFTHRQTLAGVVRFNAPELHEQALKVTQAGAHALARLDVAAALAERAAEGGWCRPTLVDQPCLEIEAGRHPVVEAALARAGGRFVANDCRLAPDARLWLVTGPNMGGKSTFLRQNALIVVLAQAGSFVPAASATLGLVDRLFSRVGASDNLARGRSTFMVEMVETAAILAQATPHSFVILDEVGRGTSTYDGLAIAWAVVEAVHEVNRCRCLFATHYHELTRLAGTLDALSLHHVRAREWKGDLVLLHEVVPGAADRSYGLAVAKLAGLPGAVLARARDVLKRLERGREQTGGIAAGLDDLPLFAASAAAATAGPDPLAEAVAALDPDAMTPKDALEALYALKRLAASRDPDHLPC